MSLKPKEGNRFVAQSNALVSEDAKVKLACIASYAVSTLNTMLTTPPIASTVLGNVIAKSSFGMSAFVSIAERSMSLRKNTVIDTIVHANATMNIGLPSVLPYLVEIAANP